MPFDKKAYEGLFNENLKQGLIAKSGKFFKIKLFLQKAENSLLIAKHMDAPGADVPKKIYWDYWAIIISHYSMLYAAKSAILSKGYEVHGHDAAQVALGHLLVPEQIEKEDLELLNQAYKIFEDEYVPYFEDARKEAHIARYSAIKTYTEKRVKEIFGNASRFVGKISLILA